MICSSLREIGAVLILGKQKEQAILMRSLPSQQVFLGPIDHFSKESDFYPQVALSLFQDHSKHGPSCQEVTCSSSWNSSSFSLPFFAPFSPAPIIHTPPSTLLRSKDDNDYAKRSAIFAYAILIPIHLFRPSPNEVNALYCISNLVWSSRLLLASHLSGLKAYGSGKMLAS